jgi:hypothetical protein
LKYHKQALEAITNYYTASKKQLNHIPATIKKIRAYLIYKIYKPNVLIPSNNCEWAL